MGIFNPSTGTGSFTPVYANYTFQNQSVTGTASAMTNLTKISDSANAMNATTGTYTFPATGFYTLNARVAFTTSSPGQVQMIFEANGSTEIAVIQSNYISTENDGFDLCSQAVPFNSGDTLQLLISSSAGATTQSGILTEFSIIRVG